MWCLCCRMTLSCSDTNSRTPNCPEPLDSLYTQLPHSLQCGNTWRQHSHASHAGLKVTLVVLVQRRIWAVCDTQGPQPHNVILEYNAEAQSRGHLSRTVISGYRL